MKNLINKIFKIMGRKKYRYQKVWSQTSVTHANEAAADKPIKEKVDDLLSMIDTLQNSEPPQNRRERKLLKTQISLYNKKCNDIAKSINKRILVY